MPESWLISTSQLPLQLYSTHVAIYTLYYLNNYLNTAR